MNGLPTNGSTIYVTLYSLVQGTWLSNVTGTVGLNVVDLPDFRLDNSATLTLTGPAGTGFVIND